MTNVSLRTLTLRPGQEEQRRLDVATEAFVLGGTVYEVAGPVAVDLTIQRAVSGDVFRLRCQTTLSGPCMRCLADAELPLGVDAREYAAQDDHAPEELRTDYVVDDELRVSEWVRDQIALGLPAQILCRPDCAGLCAVCGKDLNVEPHEHDDDAADPRWAALQDIRLDD